MYQPKGSITSPLASRDARLLAAMPWADLDPDTLIETEAAKSPRPSVPKTVSDRELHAGILDCLPHLRAFAHLLARNHAMAEDLVQDTIVRALSCRHQFKPGTNLRGWLTVILRNRYFNELRRHSRKSECQADLEKVATGISGGQEENLHIRDFKRAFACLPPTHREALVLIGASGLSYEEAAEIAGCPIGTMKSRVSRARLKLAEILNGEPSAD
jgi:RNA polymerase sigma-70 factor (ECF subfamily)